jgi:hypothetical protein
MLASKAAFWQDRSSMKAFPPLAESRAPQQENPAKVMPFFTSSPTASQDIEVGHKPISEKASSSVLSPNAESSISSPDIASQCCASGGGLTLYPTIAQFWRAYGVPPRKGDWRLHEAQVGQFHALPMMRGVACATDGVLLIVKTQNGYCMGHLDNWVKDKEERVVPNNNANRRSVVKKTTYDMALAQLLID